MWMWINIHWGNKKAIEESNKRTLAAYEEGRSTRSGITENAWTNHHKSLWQELTILQKKEQWLRSKFKEVSYTKKQLVFSHPSVDIKNIWRSFLMKISPLQRTRPKRNGSHRCLFYVFFYIKPVILSLHLVT